MIRHFRIMLGAALLAVAPQAASAQVITLQTVTQSATGGKTISGTPVMTFSEYAGTGALTQVKVAVAVATSATAQFSNPLGFSLPASLTESGSYSFTAGANTPAAISGSISSLSAQTIGNKSTSLFGGGFATLNLNDTANAPGLTFTSATDLAQFVGSGSFTLNPFANINLTTTGPNTLSSAASSSATVTITYSGIPVTGLSTVPEPSSLVLGTALGVVAAGTAALRRRRGKTPA